MTKPATPILILALVLTACGSVVSTVFTEVAQEATPPASESPVASPPPGCINPPPDLTTMIEQADPLACYGNAELTVDAHITGPGAIDCPGGLEPSWFNCGSFVQLLPLPGAAEVPQFLLVARSQGPFMFAVIHPDAPRPQNLDVLVHLAGHYDDPAAMECHLTDWPDANPPSPQEVITMCRSTFVITDMAPLAP